jgi:hypothetical protein
MLKPRHQLHYMSSSFLDDAPLGIIGSRYPDSSQRKLEGRDPQPYALCPNTPSTPRKHYFLKATMNNVSDTQQQPVYIRTLNHESLTSIQTLSPNDCGSATQLGQQSHAHESNARVSISDQKSMSVTVDTEVLAKLQSGKFQNEKLSPFKIVGDNLAVLLPLGILMFMIRIWRLDGQEINPSIFAKWTDSINVVRLTSLLRLE